MGIVYLVQPCELIGTKRLKVGMSRKNTKERIKKGYRKGTQTLSVYYCDNPEIMEKYILNEFNKHFKLIAGKEFFEGEKSKMKQVFEKCFNLNKNTKIFVSKSKKDTIGVLKTQECPACRGSGTSYWTDGIYSTCLECCCIDCKYPIEKCKCYYCNKCRNYITTKFSENWEEDIKKHICNTRIVGRDFFIKPTRLNYLSFMKIASEDEVQLVEPNIICWENDSKQGNNMDSIAIFKHIEEIGDNWADWVHKKNKQRRQKSRLLKELLMSSGEEFTPSAEH
jgi:hypothetical protein